MILFVILLPLAFGLLVNAAPMAVDYSRSILAVRESLISGDIERALEALESALEYSPWRGDLWQQTGRLYMESGELDTALTAFEEAQALGQLDPQGQVWLADMLKSNGYGDAAKHVLVNIDDRDPFILLQAAALLRTLNDHEGVVALLKKARALDAQNSELNYLLGIHLMAKEPGNALAYLELALTDASRGATAAYLVQTIQQYGELAGSGEWYLYAGQALAQAGEWDLAVYSFDSATAVMPENATAWALLGEAQQQNGDDGKSSLDEAVKLDADGEMVNGMLGLYYRRQGNLQQALTHLQIAHRANPLAAVWLIESGRTMAAMGNLEEALELFNKAIEIDKQDIEAWKARAEFSILHNYQVETTGLESARQALTLDKTNPVLMDLLGTAYMMMGDFDSAERLFSQALQHDPEQAAILIHLGQLYLYREDRETAFEYLRRAVSSARDDRLREMANRLLEENGAR